MTRLNMWDVAAGVVVGNLASAVLLYLIWIVLLG